MASKNRPSQPMARTLELALRLGHINRIPLEKRNAVENREVENQFSHLLILDFESTCWKERATAPPPEIIEFPVVLLHLSSGEILAEFHEYVMPTENPRLSEFCTELTGISQDTVDNGIPLKTCLHLFNKWIRSVVEQFRLVLDNSEGPGNMYTCCTWSDWDLNLCLENECRRKQITKPIELCSWIDIRSVYRRFYQRRPHGLNGALRDLGVEFEGREHSGIVDARNTAKLVYKMMVDGCILKQESREEVDLDAQIGAGAPNKNKPRSIFTVSPPKRKKKLFGPRIYAKENLDNVKIQVPT